MTIEKYCDLYLIRHGQTDWNVQQRVQGHTDIPLNAEGRKQAHHLKEKLQGLSFAAIFSSDLSRAKETATIFLDERKMPLQINKDFRERCKGLWEGCFLGDINARMKEQQINLDALPREQFLSWKNESTMESYEEAYNRFYGCLKTTITPYLGSTIACVTHGGLLSSLLYMRDYRPGFKWEIDNCGYIHLQMDHQGNITFIERQKIELIPLGGTK